MTSSEHQHLTTQWLCDGLASHGVIVERCLGNTEFGEIFSGTLDVDQVPIVIKVHRSNDRDELDELHAEALKIKELNHPNVESIHAIAIVENCLCIVCDEIDAPDIDAWLAGHSWEEESVLNLLKKLALTVHEIASKTNVIHGNLKPSNIAVIDNEPIILSYGLTPKSNWKFDKLQQDSNHYLMYRAPEQLASSDGSVGSERSVGEWTDVYGIGLIIYRLLTGSFPFSYVGKDTIDQIAYGRPKPPRQLNEDVPRNFEAICCKALARRVVRRYSTALALYEDLDRYSKGEEIDAIGLHRDSLAKGCFVAFVLMVMGLSIVAGIIVWLATTTNT